MTNVTISIPAPLRAYTNQQKRISVDASKIDDALDGLIDQYPKLKDHLFDGDELRQFVNIYLNNEDIRYLEKKYNTELNSGDVLAIIPAIAGGL